MAEPASAVAPPISRKAWAGQALLYALFALVIGVFSHWPPYRHLQPDQALIKVSFTHSGKPLGECRRLSAEELARLPPNMRAPVSCPRERSPVTIELDLDGRTVLSRTAPPSGLARDGASALYQRLVVPAGERHLAVRLADDARAGGFAHRREARVTLAPGQVLVVDFNAAAGGITLK